jgi:hypothetical protein
MSAAATWRVKGRFDAAGGRAWDSVALFAPRIRRAWLAGWIERAVSLHANGANDLALFHAKRPAAGEGWSSAELDLLAAGCRAIPRAPFPLLAGMLGRTAEAARIKASRCGFVRAA